MARKRTIQKQSFLTPVKRKPSLDLSVSGMIFSIMMLFMGLAAINVQANLLFGVFGLMIGVLLVGWFLSRIVMRKLDVRRNLPDSATVGNRLTLIYEFTNRKRYWPSLSVQVSELAGSEGFAAQPHAYLLHAAPGMTASVPAEVIPKRRGVQLMGNYQVSTSFPFGFVKRAQERTQQDSMIIYPAMAQVDQHVLQLCRSAEKSGSTMRPRKGGMDEFFGVKEYRQGDNPRWIHWRRSARTGVLVSREMTQVAPPRLVLAVDTQASEQEPSLLAGVERCIAMAGSLATLALEQGLLVGIVAWDGKWVYLPPQRGKRQRRDVLNVLASLPRNSDQSGQELISQTKQMLDHLATPVLFTPRKSEMSLADSARGDLVVLCESDPQVRSWFTFESSVDFAHCMPVDQDPTIKQSTKKKTLGASALRRRRAKVMRTSSGNEKIAAGVSHAGPQGQTPTAEATQSEAGARSGKS